MRVLILHRMMNPKTWRKSVESLELGYKKIFDSDDEILIWNCVYKVPWVIKNLKYDLVILTSTFMGLINFPWFKRVAADYSFLSTHCGYIVAMPQDEYQNPLARDKFLKRILVNEIYTIFPEKSGLLYPLCTMIGVKFSQGFTGYLDQDLIDYSEHKWTNNSRKIKISYRTQPQLFLFGAIGKLKTEIADFFLSIQDSITGVMDISYDSADVKFGNDWYDLLLDSEFVLGALSGSSNIDYTGKLQTQGFEDFVNSDIYEKFYPNSIYENSELVAISPRNFESAILGCCQINIVSEYNGILEPWRHYIPLNRDFSNIREVIDAMNNTSLVNEMIRQTRNLVINTKEFRIESLYQSIRNASLSKDIIPSKKIHPILLMYLCFRKSIQNILTFRLLDLRYKLKSR